MAANEHVWLAALSGVDELRRAILCENSVTLIMSGNHIHLSCVGPRCPQVRRRGRRRPSVPLFSQAAHVVGRRWWRWKVRAAEHLRISGTNRPTFRATLPVVIERMTFGLPGLLASSRTFLQRSRAAAHPPREATGSVGKRRAKATSDDC